MFLTLNSHFPDGTLKAKCSKTKLHSILPTPSIKKTKTNNQLLENFQVWSVYWQNTGCQYPTAPPFTTQKTVSTAGQYGIWWRHLPQLATPLDKYCPSYQAKNIYHTDYFHKVYFMHIFASIMYQTSIYWSGFFTHMHRCTYTHLWHFAKKCFFFPKNVSSVNLPYFVWWQDVHHPTPSGDNDSPTDVWGSAWCRVYSSDPTPHEELKSRVACFHCLREN